MLKQITVMLVLVIAALMPRQGLAQTNNQAKTAADAGQQQFYRLNFVVQELDAGKIINSRSYSMAISTNDHSEIRADARLPVTQGPGTTQYQQISVGVSIDCIHAQSLGNKLALNITAHIDSLGDSTEKTAAGIPIIRRNSWSSNVVVPLQQPTTVFSSDEPSSKRTMQLDVTATPIK